MILLLENKKLWELNVAKTMDYCIFDLQKKIHCVFVDVLERVGLLSRHKIDVKEDTT